MLKSETRFSIIGLVCCVGIICSFSACANREAEVIKIGAVLPLTGSAAPYGQNAKRGIEIAVEEVNEKGGVDGKRVEVVYEDGKTIPKDGVSALNKLYDVDKIPFIIGDINSTSVLAMAPIAERNHIILLSPGASNPKISDAGEYIFRNWHSDALEGRVDAEFAFGDLKWRKAAVLYVNAAYGVGLAEVFKETFSKLGGTVVAYEAYPQDATDMREQVSRVISKSPDGLFLPGWPKEMSVALKQLKELGSKLPILSVQGFDDPSILSLTGEAAEGVVFSVPESPDTNDQNVKSFLHKYRSKYNIEPGVCSAAGHDALLIFAWAVDSVGYDVERVRDLMADLSDFPGADGKITFDEHGDLLKPFAFKTVKDGKFESYRQ